MSMCACLCGTWTCYLVSRLSCSLWTRWCPCCQSSPGSVCRRAALQLTGAGGAGWSGALEEGALWSCGSVRGCRPWLGSRRAMRKRRWGGGFASREAPPTGTEPPPPLSAWARPDAAAALQSPADLERGGRVLISGFVLDFDRRWKIEQWLSPCKSAELHLIPTELGNHQM